jgi:hypothetical protein
VLARALRPVFGYRHRQLAADLAAPARAHFRPAGRAAAAARRRGVAGTGGGQPAGPPGGAGRRGAPLPFRRAGRRAAARPWSQSLPGLGTVPCHLRQFSAGAAHPEPDRLRMRVGAGKGGPGDRTQDRRHRERH